MRLDFWKADRESATQLDCGLKVLVSELKTKNYLVLQIWRPRAMKPYLIQSFQNELDMKKVILREIAKFKERTSAKDRVQKENESRT